MSERVSAELKSEAKPEYAPSRSQKKVLSESGNSHLEHILDLHQSLGNHAVQKLFRSGIIQAKLKIGEPDDVYEQEADRVADHVMRMPEGPDDVQDARAGEGNCIIQRKPG